MTTFRRSSHHYRLAVSAVMAACVTVASAAIGAAGQAYPPFKSEQHFSFTGNWEAIEPTVIRTFYPGAALWRDLIDNPGHPGDAKAATGTSCSACHGSSVVGQSQAAGWAGPPPVAHRQGRACNVCHDVLTQDTGDLGRRMVAHPNMEPEPIPGKRPNVDVTVRAAYDDEHLYLRFQWESERPGVSHEVFQWDGSRWSTPDTDRPGAAVLSHEDRLTLLVDDGNIAALPTPGLGFSTVGCYLSCHERKRRPVRPDVSRGDFLDMIAWRAARGGALGYAGNDHIDDRIRTGAGTEPYRGARPGEFLFNQEKNGFHALAIDDLESRPQLYLLHQNDAVPASEEAMAQVAEGSVTPRHLLQDPAGSHTSVLANSRWENGRWTVDMRRRLDAGSPGEKTFTPGHVYNIGMAIHDDHVSGRRHNISHRVSLGIGVPADITALPLR